MRPEEPVTLPAQVFEVRLPPPRKSEREYRAFQRLLPQLLQTYRGQFVAIHNEQVVDSGPDDIELIERVHAKVGYVPIYVGLVTEQPPPPVRIPHYRIHHQGAEE